VLMNVQHSNARVAILHDSHFEVLLKVMLDKKY
jgi:hypothetical protein